MGCNAEKLQIQTAEKRGLFSSLFYGQGVYLQTVQNYHKELPRLSGIIRVHSGRTERTSPITSERFSPQKPMQAHFPAGAAAAAAHSRPIKKLSPVSMRGNSQNGGQTTKSLLTKPQCSGVPIQQAVSLSSSFPRHCLLFVCAFFRKMQAGARSEELPLPPPPAYKTAPASCYGNRGGSFALGALFQALTQNLARGLLVSPAYAGKSPAGSCACCITSDHPRICGEKTPETRPLALTLGSPPRMRGKAYVPVGIGTRIGITPACAGKGPPDACSQPYA